ncbi:hypothetical protein SBADM41S_03643 [Streptomyces badius]
MPTAAQAQTMARALEGLSGNRWTPPLRTSSMPPR